MSRATVDRLVISSCELPEHKRGGPSTRNSDSDRTPEKAQLAGPDRWPGFDLLSRRPSGDQRCIEVKGRRAVGDVELHENEWAKAANLREQYWLYVVYDCVAAYPRLLRVADPFATLLVRAKGGAVIGEMSVFESAEAE